MKWWGGIAVFLAVVLSGQNAYATDVTDHVVINEIMANPATGEVEWIELYNPTDAPIDMNGWRLVVTSGNFSGVFASDAVIASHGYVVRSASDTTSKLNNTSATITLRPSASGAAIDTVVYSGIMQAKTYARECDASDAWIAQAVPTKNTTNCAPLPPQDITPPLIADITNIALSGNATIIISATDESSVAMITANITQYGTEIATTSGAGNAQLQFDTTSLPNGPATVAVTAKDAAGNVAVRTFEIRMQNTTQPSLPPAEPAAKPIIVSPPATPTPAPVAEPVEIPVSEPTIPIQLPVVSAIKTVSATQAVPKIVASPTIISVASARGAVSSSTAKSDQTDAVAALVPASNQLSSNGGTAKKAGVSNTKSTYSNTYTIYGGIGVAIVSFALWRYLRRTKP